MKTLILVVNYKKEILESETIKNLLKINHLLKDKYDIFVWDNCALEDNHQKIKKIENVKYRYSKENRTLSYIYNKIISEELEAHDYLMILDNDSQIKEKYFIEFEKAIEIEKNINLFIPKIKNKQGQIRSPRKIEIKLLKTEEEFYENGCKGLIEAKNIFAINSGMAIKVEYLKNGFKGYHSKLNYYGTDDYFMQQYQKNNQYCYVLDYDMEHEFALNNENEEIGKKIWRYKDCQNGLSIRKQEYTPIIRFRIIFSQFKDALTRSIKSKNFGYLKALFEVWRANIK